MQTPRSFSDPTVTGSSISLSSSCNLATSAEFATLAEADLTSIKELPFSERDLPVIQSVRIRAGAADFYRLPFYYGGFMLSDRALGVLIRAKLDRCLEFVRLQTLEE